MKIEHSETAAGGEFFAGERGAKSALMTYRKSGAKEITIDHTEVSGALKGKGVGKELVAAGVNFARENNLKIVAVCPFVEAEFEKNKDYADVRAK